MTGDSTNSIGANRGWRGAIVVASVATLALGLTATGRMAGGVPDRGAKPIAVVLPDMRLDLNSADAGAIRELPGVGPALADRLVACRERHGPWTSLDELAAVEGVGPKTIERLRPFAIVE